MLKSNTYITTRFSFILLLGMIIGSCQMVNHGNFNKQKYLKGNLRSTCGDEGFVGSKKSLIQHSDIQESMNVITTIEESFSLEEESQHEQFESTFQLRKEVQKVRKRVKERYHKSPEVGKKLLRRNNAGSAIAWFIVLLALGLLSLVLFIWIGWWSMLVCGLFFIAALLVILSFDPPKPRHRNPISGMLFGIILGVIVGGLIAIGILALIIWGIVAIILAIIN